ncbi:unnamed protein product [Prunus brigantina]
MTSIGDVNQLLIVAVVLDPRYKVDYVHISFGDLEEDASKVNAMISGVKDLVMKLYEAYRKEDPVAAQAYVEANFEGAEETSIVGSDERLEKCMRSRKEKYVIQIENEVDKYLLEPPENPKNAGFNLLDWWKENLPRFPVSSVPSEAAFSARKRVVDPFRASLTPKTVETLICSNDWLRAASFNFNKEPTEDELEFYITLEKMEKEMETLQMVGKENICTNHLSLP